MKKLLFILAIVCGTISVDAQTVYKQVLENATQKVNDPQLNNVVKSINQFKVDELKYMSMKMREQMPDSSIIFLDKQAYAMNNYVDLFVSKIIEYKEKSTKEQTNLIHLFMDASISNSLFNDMDKELVESYYNNTSCLTRFSLDTDWRKALAAVVTNLPK